MSTYAFDGLWRQLGYVAWREDEERGDTPVLTFWAGGLDLAPDTTKDMLVAVLSKDGETVAHGKRTTTLLRDGHLHRDSLMLFHPHERDREYTAKQFRRQDWADGEYELKIARLSDMGVIRNFRVTVRDGELVPHERSALDDEPRQDLLVPRANDGRSSSYEFVEITWVESR